jgi:hypothetical protein
MEIAADRFEGLREPRLRATVESVATTQGRRFRLRRGAGAPIR